MEKSWENLENIGELWLCLKIVAMFAIYVIVFIVVLRESHHPLHGIQ